MLAGVLSYFEGATQVCSLRFNIGMCDSDPDLLAFVTVESESDHLPPRHVQHRWSSASIQRLQPELEKTEIWAKGVATQAGHTLIERFAQQ